MDIRVVPEVKLCVGLPQVYTSYEVVPIHGLAPALPGAQLLAVITAFEEGLPQTYFLLGRGACLRADTYGGFELRVSDDDVADNEAAPSSETPSSTEVETEPE